jgi:DNA-binding CsgD family transcriptional regulator
MDDEEQRALEPQLEPTSPPSETTKPPTPYRKPSRQKTLIGKGQGSPNHAAKSVKNSYTSPKAIHRQKRKAEALALREQGYSFDQIAKHMHCAVGTVHGYVVEALKEIPAETAVEVLRLELQRLDALLSTYYDSGVGGDLAGATMALRLIEARAKLLGLYPDKQSAALAVSINGDQTGDQVPIRIEFIVPGPQPELAAPRDVTPEARKVQPVERRDYEPPVIEQTLGPQPSVPLVGKKRGFDWS